MDAIKTILFPTDFTPVANNALHYAINLAEKAKAELVIFHAFRVPVPVGTEIMIPIPDIDEFEKIAREQLNELEISHPLHRVKHITEVREGFLLDTIQEVSKEKHADLIIMGTGGSNGRIDLFASTRAADAVGKIHCPVLVIPEQSYFKDIKKIAFAFDYKELENPGKLDILKVFAELFNAELHILYVAKSDKVDVTDDFSSLTIIHEVLEKVHPEFRVRLKDDVEKGIDDYINEKSIDMVAVMPRKHGFLEGLFHKSVAKKLAYHTHIPLLAIQD